MLCLDTQFCSISYSHSFWLTLTVSYLDSIESLSIMNFLSNIYSIYGVNLINFIPFSFIIALGKQQAVFSKEELQERNRRRKGETVVTELRHYLQNSGSLNGK